MITLGDRRTYFFNVVREESNDFRSMSETSENVSLCSSAG